MCVVDDISMRSERYHAAAEMLALVSDGITEAMNSARALTRRARLKALLEQPSRRDIDLTVLGNEVLAAVKTFEAGAEPSDDQTLLLVSWRGPQ